MKESLNSAATGPGDTSDESIDVLLQNRSWFLSFLRRSNGLEADLEDVLQDCFVKSLERRGTLRDSDKIVAWFFRVLRNQLVDRHRQATRHKCALALLRWQADAVGCSGPQWDSLHFVEQLMPRLAPRHRETLQVLCATGGDLSALALHHGTTVNHAAVRACRARQALRKLCQDSEPETLS